MKTDTYTKAILTIIAIALTLNVFQNFSPIQTAKAEVTDDLPSCDICDEIDDVNRKLRNVESTLSDIEGNSFGNYCGNCPEN